MLFRPAFPGRFRHGPLPRPLGPGGLNGRLFRSRAGRLQSALGRRPFLPERLPFRLFPLRPPPGSQGGQGVPNRIRRAARQFGLLFFISRRGLPIRFRDPVAAEHAPAVPRFVAADRTFHGYASLPRYTPSITQTGTEVNNFIKNNRKNVDMPNRPFSTSSKDQVGQPNQLCIHTITFCSSTERPDVPYPRLGLDNVPLPLRHTGHAIRTFA